MLEWGEVATQFSLGNAAILTNVCLLPLYPGLIAFLAGNVTPSAMTNEETPSARTERPIWVTGLLGAFVLAGVLTVMIALGLVLHLLDRAFADIFNVLLPIVYVAVILLGALMLTGRNPFARLSMMQAPVLRNPFATAFLYGMLLGPMTLPCTGPVIASAFLLGTTQFSTIEVEIVYFIAFGIGFGWPLLVLPLFAAPAQKRFTGWLTRHHTLLTRASGTMLILIGLFGFYTEFIDGGNALIA